MSECQGQVNLSRYALASTTTRARPCPTTGDQWCCAIPRMGKHTRHLCNGTANTSGAGRSTSRQLATSATKFARWTQPGTKPALRPSGRQANSDSRCRNVSVQRWCPLVVLHNSVCDRLGEECSKRIPTCRSAIHPSAWKGNSAKFTCRILNIRPYWAGAMRHLAAPMDRMLPQDIVGLDKDSLS